MKTLLLFLSFFTVANAQIFSVDTLGNVVYDVQNYTVVTDSSSLVLYRVLNVGNTRHAHVWLYDSRYRKGGDVVDTTIVFPGIQKNLDRDIEPRICESCLRNELREAILYQRIVPKTTSRYQQLEATARLKKGGL